jgi:hypothetical protein
MPLTGLGLGTALARGIGQAADYLAGAAVIVIGTWMLRAGDTGEEDEASRITSSRGLALIALGLSISLDELAIGFTIGLAHLPVTALIVAIALQAFIAAQLGRAIGTRIGDRRLQELTILPARTPAILPPESGRNYPTMPAGFRQGWSIRHTSLTTAVPATAPVSPCPRHATASSHART